MYKKGIVKWAGHTIKHTLANQILIFWLWCGNDGLAMFTHRYVCPIITYDRMVAYSLYSVHIYHAQQRVADKIFLLGL